jgi:hypothetical protein
VLPANANRLHHLTALQQELSVELAIFVFLVIKNANRSKYLAVGPADRETQVRDHPQFGIGVRFPIFVAERVRDEQRLASLHHGLAVKAGIETRGFSWFVRIPF